VSTLFFVVQSLAREDSLIKNKRRLVELPALRTASQPVILARIIRCGIPLLFREEQQKRFRFFAPLLNFWGILGAELV